MARDGKFAVGDRVVVDDCFGSVRYIGEVPPNQDSWLGIEWDDAQRGKHNGTYEGRVYFSTRNGAPSGSFIRPKRVSASICCCTALRARYGEADTETPGKGLQMQEEIYMEAAGNSRVKVELVGMDRVKEKQSKFEDLKNVGLSSMNIYGEPHAGLLGPLLKNVVSLDLSRNLFLRWNQVADVTRNLPNLSVLNLSENRLQLPADSDLDDLQVAFSRIRSLILRKMALTWSDVVQCSKLWPHISELHVDGNEVTCIDSLPADRLRDLRLLNLDDNDLDDWHRVSLIGRFPRLEMLHLNRTGLKNIDISDGEFPLLKVLLVSSNKIADWRSINKLSRLPCLESLLISDNPLCSASAAADRQQQEYNTETRWQLTVAKLGHLKYLNRSEIPAQERKEAERDYIKMFAKDWLLSGGGAGAAAAAAATSAAGATASSGSGSAAVGAGFGSDGAAARVDEKATSAAQLSAMLLPPTGDRSLATFYVDHPRYLELIHKHGAPEAADVFGASTTSKSGLISVYISAAKMAGGDTGKSLVPSIKKSIPVSMTVDKVKVLAQKLCRVSNPGAKLFYICHKTGQKFELDNDLRQLSFYAVEEGDTIVVH